MLFRAKANQLQIFLHRGYDIDQDELQQFSWTNYDEYEMKRDRCLRRIKRRKLTARKVFSGIYKKDKESTFVVFVTEGEGSSKIKSQTINSILAEASKKGLKDIFLISAQDHKIDTLKYVQESGFRFEIYTEAYMTIERLNHVMNPVFTPLTEEEAKDFFTETSLSGARMPRFAKWNTNEPSTGEPILQHYRYQSGTIVKIYRENNYTKQIASESVYWRIVT